MKLDNFVQQLRLSLEKELTAFNPDSDEMLRLGELLRLIRTTLSELKMFVSTYQFRDEAEEIRFFRHHKPALASFYFYYKKIFEFRLFDSFRDHRTIRINYESELRKIARWTGRHNEFYQYWVTGSTELDHHYFLRNRTMCDAVDRDEKFSTGFDTQVARIQANEMIKAHILRKLAQSSGAANTALTWSESKVALTELVYALHACQAFNQGTVDIKEIATAVETCFNISLGNYYRVFQDIRARKNNPTSFLDQLRQKLQQQISNSDG